MGRPCSERRTRPGAAAAGRRSSRRSRPGGVATPVGRRPAAAVPAPSVPERPRNLRHCHPVDESEVGFISKPSIRIDVKMWISFASMEHVFFHRNGQSRSPSCPSSRSSRRRRRRSTDARRRRWRSSSASQSRRRHVAATSKPYDDAFQKKLGKTQ